MTSLLYKEKTICGKRGRWFEPSLYRLDKLPSNYYCAGSLSCDKSDLTELPEGLIIEENLYIGDCEISELPHKLVIGGDLILLNSSIFDLPSDICICGDIIALKVNNPPHYEKNTIYDGFICDKDGKVIPYKKTFLAKRECVGRDDSFMFYEGVFKHTYAARSFLYGDIISCTSYEDAEEKIILNNLTKSGAFEYYKDYNTKEKKLYYSVLYYIKELLNPCSKEEFNDILELHKRELNSVNRYSVEEVYNILKPHITRIAALNIFEKFFLPCDEQT